MKKIDSRVFLNRFSFFSRAKQDLLRKIIHHLQDGVSPWVIYTPNAEQMVQTKHQPKLAGYLQAADILLPDGKGLVWGNNYLSALGKTQRIEERIAGIDLVKDLIGLIQDKNLEAVLIGGHNYQPNQLPPNLTWVEGYQQIDKPQPSEEKNLKELLLDKQPDIVFVAFGAPQQEAWIIEHLDWLNQAEVKIAMVVGGSFDVLTGKLKRAPDWMQQLGLEWLFRLLQQPWRWKRQLRLIEFSWMVFKSSLE